MANTNNNNKGKKGTGTQANQAASKGNAKILPLGNKAKGNNKPAASNKHIPNAHAAAAKKYAPKVINQVDFRKLLLSGNNVDYMFFDGDYNLEMEMNETVILMASNGVFEIIKTPIGLFNIQLAAFSLPLPELKKFNAAYLWAIPKPDISLLYDLMALNKAVLKKYSSEVFAPIVYDTVTKKYSIVVPKQTVSGAHVTYDKVVYPENTIQVIDHHSHANMGAFFSGTDDGDDKQVRFKISIVIGKNGTTAPELKARLTINGNFVPVEIDTLFSQGSGSNIKSLLKNVSKQEVNYGYGVGVHGHKPKPAVGNSPGHIAKAMPKQEDILPMILDDELPDFSVDLGDNGGDADEEAHIDHLLDLELDIWGIFEAIDDDEITAIIAKYRQSKGLDDAAIDEFIIAASEFLG